MSVTVRHIEDQVAAIRRAAPLTWAALADTTIAVADGEAESLAPWAAQLLELGRLRPIGITNALLDGLDAVIENHVAEMRTRIEAECRADMKRRFGLADDDPRWRDDTE